MLAGPQIALGDDHVQLRVVGIGGQGAIQLRNRLGVDAGAVIAHSQQCATLKTVGIDREGLAKRFQGRFKIPQLELGQSQIQLEFPDVRFDRQCLPIAAGGFLIKFLARKREASFRQGRNIGSVAGIQGLAPRSAPGASRQANGQQNAEGAPAADHAAPALPTAGPVDSRTTRSGSMIISRPGSLLFAASGTSMPNARWPIRSRGMCKVVSGG